MSTEDDRERMQMIRMLEQDLAYERGRYYSFENDINQLIDDYNKYVVAMENIEIVKGDIRSGQGDVYSGGNKLGKYAGGNKYEESYRLILSVSQMFESTLRGADSIETIITSDVEKLNEEYKEAYRNYVSIIAEHNEVAYEINSLGGSAKILEDSYCKSSLL